VSKNWPLATVKGVKSAQRHPKMIKTLGMELKKSQKAEWQYRAYRCLPGLLSVKAIEHASLGIS
jgi:hypothetical protein